MKKLINLILNLTILTSLSTLVISCLNNSSRIHYKDENSLDGIDEIEVNLSVINVRIDSIEDIDTKDKLFSATKKEVTNYLNWQYDLNVNNKDYDIKTEAELDEEFTKEFIESLEFYLDFNAEFSRVKKVNSSPFNIILDIESEKIKLENRLDIATIEDKIVLLQLDYLNSTYSRQDINNSVKEHIISQIELLHDIEIAPSELIVEIVNSEENSFDRNQLSKLEVKVIANESSDKIKGILENVTFIVEVNDAIFNISYIQEKMINIALEYENSQISLKNLQTEIKNQINTQIYLKSNIDALDDLEVSDIDIDSKKLDKEQLSTLNISVQAKENSDKIIGVIRNIKLNVHINNPNTYIQSVTLREDYNKHNKQDDTKFDFSNIAELPQDAFNIKVLSAKINVITDSPTINISTEVKEKYLKSIEFILNSDDKSFLVTSLRESIGCFWGMCSGDKLSVWSDDLGWTKSDRVSRENKIIFGKVILKYVSIDLEFTYELNS